MASARPNRRRTILILLVLTSITLITLDTRGGDSGVGGRVRNARTRPVRAGAGRRRQRDAADRGLVGRRHPRRRHQGREPQAAARAAGGARAGGDGAGVDRDRSRRSSGWRNLPFVGDLKGVDAQIILGSPGNFESTVVLDKGTGDGIVVDQPVVSGRGLLGRIARASAKRSTVLLLTDRDSGVERARRADRRARDHQRSARRRGADPRPGPRRARSPFKARRRARHRRHRRRSVPAGHPGRARVVGAEAARVTSCRASPCELYADAGATEFVRVLEWPIP